MNADWLVWGIAGLAILISLANPGGLLIGAAIAFVVLGGRYGLPYVGDVLRERQSGVGAAKARGRVRDSMRGENRGDDRD